MKLTYWVVECEDDSQAYNLRAKTKREAVARAQLENDSYDPSSVRKVTIEYADGFDLLAQCLGEGGIYEGGN